MRGTFDTGLNVFVVVLLVGWFVVVLLVSWFVVVLLLLLLFLFV